MQLILNVDTDIDVQKMSTIEQESLDEKFINNSVIEKVCIDINDVTNGNGDCVPSQECFVKVFENNVTAEESITQAVESRHDIFVNEKNNVESESGGLIFGNKSPEIKEGNSKLENEDIRSQVEDKLNVLGNVSSEIEEIMEVDVNDIDKLEENSLKKDNNEKKGDKEINIERNIEKQVNENCETEDKIEEDDQIEDKQKSEIEGKAKEQNKNNCGVDEKFDEQDRGKSKIKYTFIEQDKEKREIDGAPEEQDKHYCEVEEKFDEQDRGKSKTERIFMEQGKEEREIGDKHKEQDKRNCGVEEKLDELDRGESKRECTFMEEKSEIDDKLGEEKDNYVCNKFEEKDEGKSKTEHKCMEQDKEVVNKFVVRDQDPHGIEDLSEEQEKGKSETEDKLEERHRYNIGVKGKIEEQANDNCSMKDKFEEQEEMNSETNYELEEQVKVKSKIDNSIKKSEQTNCEMEFQNRSSTEIRNCANEQNVGNIGDCIMNQLENEEQPPSHVTCETDMDHNNIDGVSKNNVIHLDEAEKQTLVKLSKQTDESEMMHNYVELKNNIDNDKIVLDTEEKQNLQHSNAVNSQNLFNNDSKIEANQVKNSEIIDIADERDEDIVGIIDQNMKAIENASGKNVNSIKNEIGKEITESLIKNNNQGMEIDLQEENNVEMNDKETVETSVQHTKGVELEIHEEISKKAVVENLEEKKKLTHICKLSNTLDILSDEDEDKENPDEDFGTADKQCIDIEDDDDIMLIDEESNSKDSKNKSDSSTEIKNDAYEESKLNLKNKEENAFEISTSEKDTLPTEVTTASITEMKSCEDKEEVTVQEETKIEHKPLLPVNFLKTCKKNLADMTREELEEFCILKIVESVVDRSNLSEIKTQLKSVAQNIEEYRKKTSILTKQNRDLQVVLKSVQEEQKKKSNMPITPLKITRSVGMQVLMTDKSGVRRKPLQNTNTQNNVVSNNASNRTGKGQCNQNTRIQKTQTNTVPPIPVPRLVPAASSCNINNVKVQPPNANTSVKSQVSGPVTSIPIQSVPNGLTTILPAPKPEKRPHSRMQQINSVTVDLTDDEPPAKVIQRNIAPPVRLVPPQNLLAPHRQPFGTSVNSPRKVYIPISGSQNQGVRSGQTIMLKTMPPQGPRQRCPSPAIAKSNQGPNTVRMQRMPSRHPAPLPDSIKQYQPLNWKALPPAPEIKLSKVDNGIVISWKIDGYQEDNHEEIASYQLYAYQETSSPPSTTLWKKIGDVKALPLPMACTLTQFMAGYKYYFAVRAVDVRSRLGPFSSPGSILLLNKM